MFNENTKIKDLNPNDLDALYHDHKDILAFVEDNLPEFEQASLTIAEVNEEIFRAGLFKQNKNKEKKV